MNRNINLNVEKANNSSSHYRINLVVAKLCELLEEKEAISHIDSEKILNRFDRYDYSILHQYIQLKDGIISLIPELISQLADRLLEQEFGIPCHEMFDEDGQFFEQFQNRFNDLYDDLEEELTNLDFKTL